MLVLAFAAHWNDHRHLWEWAGHAQVGTAAGKKFLETLQGVLRVWGPIEGKWETVPNYLYTPGDLGAKRISPKSYTKCLKPS